MRLFVELRRTVLGWMDCSCRILRGRGMRTFHWCVVRVRLQCSWLGWLGSAALLGPDNPQSNGDGEPAYP
jgi:hypothetical protein